MDAKISYIIHCPVCNSIMQKVAENIFKCKQVACLNYDIQFDVPEEPTVKIHTTEQHWKPTEFKGHLQVD